MLLRIHRIFDYIFPYVCLRCDRAEDTLLCDACAATIRPPTVHRCPLCTAPTTANGALCSVCRARSALDGVIIATDDPSGVIRHLIHAYKYQCMRIGDAPLGQMLIRALLRIIHTSEALVLIPVPLHRRRERWRGFNQSLLLARSIARATDIVLLPHILQRIRHTKAQAHLDRAARRRNMHDMFRVTAALPPCTIILVDDVMTTGSTLNACARMLKGAGVRHVYGLVVSRGTGTH